MYLYIYIHKYKYSIACLNFDIHPVIWSRSSLDQIQSCICINTHRIVFVCFGACIHKKAFFLRIYTRQFEVISAFIEFRINLCRIAYVKWPFFFLMETHPAIWSRRCFHRIRCELSPTPVGPYCLQTSVHVLHVYILCVFTVWSQCVPATTPVSCCL